MGTVRRELGSRRGRRGADGGPIGATAPTNGLPAGMSKNQPMLGAHASDPALGDRETAQRWPHAEPARSRVPEGVDRGDAARQRLEVRHDDRVERQTIVRGRVSEFATTMASSGTTGSGGEASDSTMTMASNARRWVRRRPLEFTDAGRVEREALLRRRGLGPEQDDRVERKAVVRDSSGSEASESGSQSHRPRYAGPAATPRMRG